MTRSLGPVSPGPLDTSLQPHPPTLALAPSQRNYSAAEKPKNIWSQCGEKRLSQHRTLRPLPRTLAPSHSLAPQPRAHVPLVPLAAHLFFLERNPRVPPPLEGRWGESRLRTGGWEIKGGSG